MILVMKKLFGISILLLLMIVEREGVSAQELSLPEMTDLIAIESPVQFHNYSYQVEDDGGAKVWLRADNVLIPLSGGEYRLILPDNQVGDPLTWYKENGCQKYNGADCLTFGTQGWKQAEHVLSGSNLAIKIPKRNVLKPQDDVPITIGVAWVMRDITKKEWWGRRVDIKSATSDQLVSSLSIGVSFPEGVSYRDNQTKPVGWGGMMSEIVGKSSPMMGVSNTMSDYAMPYVFDNAGMGMINRYTNNLFPGDNYSFNVMTSTSIWKLYIKEILSGMVWVLAIAVVLALLLFMVIGKKSLLWYGAVVMLVSTLIILIFGLLLSFNFTFGTGGDEVFPMYNEGGSGIGSKSQGVESIELVGEPEIGVESKKD